MHITPIAGASIMAVFTVIGLIGHTPMPSWVPPKIALAIQSTCVWLATLGNGVGVALHLWSAPIAGPLAN